MAEPSARRPTSTSSFGAGRRESHDASSFYDRGLAVVPQTDNGAINPPAVVDRIFHKSAESMDEVVDNSVALMVTSPPYHVGKEYDSDSSFDDYLGLLRRVFTETYRVLEPGGRAVVNVANLGRRPYIPLNAHVALMMNELGFLMRGEVIWRKGAGANGSCAWGSWRSASNPTLRDTHEYCLCFSKGEFRRQRRGINTIDGDEFLAATLSVWDIRPESARRVGHPAPFPVELPARFIQLYTFEDDLVLDPFMGAGTTAVAAVRAGRHYVGYDTDANYVAAAVARIAQEQAIAEAT
ncbi:MAG: site-specific DNA-methyltransferase [Actinobacteria bacterium]|nr:site-specific DNA-methyltransferase [Actinomycetota bacterium]